MIKQLLEHLLSSIVTHPDAVQVQEQQTNGRTIFSFTVATQDRGRVIGRDGRTIKVLRTIVKSFERDGTDYDVELVT